MDRRRLLLFFMALAALPARADHGAWAKVGLNGRPLLRGFVPAKDARRTLIQTDGMPVREGSYFRGATELRWQAILFPTAAARDAWCQRMTAGSSAPIRWMTPERIEPYSNSWHPAPRDAEEKAKWKRQLEESMARQGVTLGDADLEALVAPRTGNFYAPIRVGRVALFVSGHAHRDMVRRGQQLASSLMADGALRRLVREAARTLAKQARAIP